MRVRFRRAPPPTMRWVMPLIALVLLIIRHAVHNARGNDAVSLRSSKDEMVPVYELPPTFSIEPSHLTPIDPSTLIPKGSYSIDLVHRKGHLHTGHVLYVMDAAGKILFLQRSLDVVTCPGTWSILGEHSNAGEDAIETVVRGVEEELGFVALNFDDSEFRGAWTANFHPRNRMEDTLRVTVQNMTEFPMYYIRHYGPRMDNRIDRQLTYLWMVHFPKRHEQITWNLDHEVVNHKWMSLDDVEQWLSDDAKKDTKIYTSAGGVEDDGPDIGDFCHRTIRSLYEAGLTNFF